MKRQFRLRMRKPTHLVVGVLFALAAGFAPLHAQEADATFKTGVAQLYKDWILGRPFLFAYEVHSFSVVKGKVGTDIHREVRMALDVATKRFVWERHDWPVADEPALYQFVRWDGSQLISGGSPVPRVVRGAGKPVTTLAEAPVGVPLCTALLMNEVPGDALILLNEIPEVAAAGFSLEGKSTELRLAELLKDPKARLEHLEGSGPDDLTLSLLDKRIVFDARRGLIKETQGFGGSHMKRVVQRFVNQMPVEITMVEDFAKEQAQNRTEYKAFPGQCRVMSAQEFADLIQLALPPDIAVRHLRRRPQVVVPAKGN